MRNGNGHVKDLLAPHNTEAEEAVLGSLLIDPDAILTVGQYLKPDDFYIDRNGWIYEAIKELHGNGAPADLVTLSDILEKSGKLSEIGGDAYLTRLIGITPTSVHAEWYGRIVERAAVRRRLLEASAQIAKLAHTDDGDDPNELLGQAEGVLLGVLDNRIETNVISAEDAMTRTAAHLERVCQAGGRGITGIPTGLTDLDRLLGGLQRSDMVVMAGRPGMGKTSLGIQIGVHAAKKHGKRVLIFSLEMSAEQLMQRIWAAESGVDSQRIRAGQIRQDEWHNLHQAQELINHLPIHIIDNPSQSPQTLRSYAIRHHARHGLDLLIVDYLQLMNGNGVRGQNRNQEISDISRTCKVLARELNIPVLALSQLSRQVESRHDKRPILSDLRESGAIEQDADIVLFIYRDDVYNPDSEFPSVAEVIVAKHRSGPTGVFSTYFKKHLTQFLDLEVRTVAPYQID